MSASRLGSHIWPIARQTAKYVFYYAFPSACFIHTFIDYVGEAAPSMGPSMAPTLNIIGDLLLIERLPGWRDRINVGEIVSFVSPISPEKRACKRVLGMPGDVICVDPTVDNSSYTTVPKGHVWLQGDNYSNSTDSRTYGSVPLGLLRGRVLACIWPSPRWLSSSAEIVPGHFEEPSKPHRK
ncbi:hypothetical protein IWW48_001197 [Coemansia sp. RSA 1200]|nr:hypothetical protein IWW48_001197 [Coemansia sp. RSA 1200]